MKFVYPNDIRAKLEIEPVYLFVGCIISIWSPSNIPSATRLKNLITESLIQTAQQLKTDIDLSTLLKENYPRLEAVLEELYYCLGDKYIEFLFPLDQTTPNALHCFIAENFKKGRIAGIYTTNQDYLIEESLKNFGWYPDRNFKICVPDEEFSDNFSLPRIYKLHGCIKKPESIRIIFRQIGKQLRPSLANHLYEDLSRYKFIFLGYSGQDIDIRPILFRANIRNAFWLELPERLTNNHISNQLRSLGKNVIPMIGDMSEILIPFEGDKLSITQSDSSLAQKYNAIMRKYLAENGLNIFLLSRLVRLSKDKDMDLKRKKLISVEISFRGTPDEMWRYQYDIAESTLFKSVWIRNNILAFWHYYRGYKFASLSYNVLGKILCLRGMGMSIDEAFCGLFPPCYLFGLYYFYPRALKLARRIKNTEEREFACSLVNLLIARSYFQLGKYNKSKVKFLSIYINHGGSSFLKGHSLRFLSCIKAFEGKFANIDETLQQAFDEFAYIENRIEQIDVLRTKAKCYLINGEINKFKITIEEALNGYRLLRNKRGVIRTIGLKAIFKTISFQNRYRLFKRLVLIF